MARNSRRWVQGLGFRVFSVQGISGVGKFKSLSLTYVGSWPLSRRAFFCENKTTFLVALKNWVAAKELKSKLL